MQWWRWWQGRVCFNHFFFGLCLHINGRACWCSRCVLVRRPKSCWWTQPGIIYKFVISSQLRLNQGTIFLFQTGGVSWYPRVLDLDHPFPLQSSAWSKSSIWTTPNPGPGHWQKKAMESRTAGSHSLVCFFKWLLIFGILILLFKKKWSAHNTQH